MTARGAAAEGGARGAAGGAVAGDAGKVCVGVKSLTSGVLGGLLVQVTVIPGANLAAAQLSSTVPGANSNVGLLAATNGNTVSAG